MPKNDIDAKQELYSLHQFGTKTLMKYLNTNNLINEVNDHIVGDTWRHGVLKGEN